MSTEEHPEKKSPVLQLKDGGSGGAGRAELLAKFRGTILDTNGDNFLGSGMTFMDWSITEDRLRYDRWYGTQSREESHRRLGFIIGLCAEQERLLAVSIQATGLSERLIEDVIQGDWNSVKMGIDTLKFDEERLEYRREISKRFARFVEIAQEAYDTRPKVFCPVCMRPAPAESIGAFHDGRHVCPWCEIVHDDEGQWLERDKANLSIAKDP